MILPLLKEKIYYIIYQNYVIKGKNRFFKGKVIEVNHNDLSLFIKRATRGADRNYFIIPKTETPNHLLKINADGGVMLFGTS